MVKKAPQKRGTKAQYVAYGGRPVTAIVAGKQTGLCQDKEGNFYYMYDCPDTGKRKKARCTKDLKIAYNRFMEFVEGAREEEYLQVDKVATEIVKRDLNDIPKNFVDKYGMEKIESFLHFHDRMYEEKTQVSEQEFFEWLESYRGKEEELKRKSGIAIQFLNKQDRATHIKISEVFDFFKENVHFKLKRTKDNYEKWIEHFFNFTKVHYIDDITEDTIRNYELEYLNPTMKDGDEKHPDGFKFKWKNDRAGAIKKCLSYYAEKHPSKSAKVQEVRQWLMIWDRTKDRQALNPDSLTVEDFKKLYQIANVKWKAILLMSLNTMSGATNLSDIKIEHINFERKTLKMIREKKETLKVGYLWDETIEALQTYLKTRKDKSEWLFINYHKKKYATATLENYFRELCRKYNDEAKKIEDEDERKEAMLSKNNITFGMFRNGASTAADDGYLEVHYIEYALGHEVQGAGKSIGNYVGRKPERMKPVADNIYKAYKIDEL